MFFTKEEFEKLKLKSDDILVCEGGDIGRTALYSDELVECAYQNHLHRLRTKNENDSQQFFVYWMNYAINHRKMYIQDGNRTTIPNLSSSRLKCFQIPHPPFEEQHKIASVLSIIQTAQGKTKTVINTLKELKQSMMKYLFTYGPVRLEETKNVKLKETEIGQIPNEWNITELRDQTEIIDCKHVTPTYAETGVPLIRPRNLKEGKIDYDNVEHISEKDYQFFTEKHAPTIGDIIFSRNASYGNCAYINTNQKICIGQDMIVITKKKANTLFIYYLFQSDTIQNQINHLSTGSTIHRINLKDICRLLVPIPSVREQEKIIEILTSVDEKIALEQSKKNSLEELFKSMLHNLMTAKIRVNNLKITSKGEIIHDA